MNANTDWFHVCVHIIHMVDVFFICSREIHPRLAKTRCFSSARTSNPSTWRAMALLRNWRRSLSQSWSWIVRATMELRFRMKQLVYIVISCYCCCLVPSKLVPKQGFQEEVPKQGSQPQVPRNRCPYKFPKNRFTSKVPGKSSQAMFPGKGSQARFPGTASQARLLKRFSSKVPRKRFASKGSQLFLEILLGNSSSWERLLENLFLRALFLLGTLLGNGSLDLAWEPFLGTVLASGSEELNLAWEPLPGYLLGSLFLGTCLGTFFPNSKSLGSSATPGTRFPIKFSRNRFASKVTSNDSQARFPHTEAFTHRSFTQRSFYTKKLLHKEAFPHRSFYTQELLHTDAFTHRRFYTGTFYTQKYHFTAVFDDQTSFRAKALSRTLQNRNFPQFLAIEPSFVRKGCDGHFKIAILHQFLAIETRFVRKGCDRHFKNAILQQFLAIEPHFVRKGCRCPAPKREIEKKEKEEGKRAREQEGKRERGQERLWRCEDVKMWGCEDVRMSRCENVKMWGFENVKMWRWEDVKMWECEDEKMWR